METCINIATDLDIAFKEFSNCIQFLGAEKTMQALKNLRYRETNVRDDVVCFVFETVTNETGVTMEELLTSRTWSLPRTVSIGICTYIFYNYFDYSAKKIELILKKKKSTCWRNMAIFKGLSPTNQQESKLLDAYKIIESNVKLYLTNNPL